LKKVFINSSNKIRSGWKIILLFFAIFGSQFLISIAMGLAAVLASAINQGDYREVISVLSHYMSYASSIMSIIIVWLFFRIMEKKKLSESGIPNIKSGYRDLILGLLLGAISMTVIFIAMLWTGNIGIKEKLLEPVFNSSLYGGLILFILVGIEEEYIFRGFIMNVLWQTKNKLVVFIVSALIFSAAHGLNPNISGMGLLNIFLVGLLFAYMFYKTKSLWMPIGYHITWNFFQGNIYGFPVSGTEPSGIYTIINTKDNLITGGGFGPEGGILATAVIVLGGLFVFTYSSSKREKKINCDL
jgi:membrane protease YdiL (CAAX protease family)